MRKVDYRFEYDKTAGGLVSLTICEEINACVGSVACGHCDYYGGINHQQSYVLCKKREKPKPEFKI